MTFSRRIKFAPIWITLAIALAIVLAVGLARPKPAGALIHEIIGALCHGGEVVPPGQAKAGQSFVRALQATGFITDINASAFPVIEITFDVDVPASKFKSTGVDPAFVFPPDGTTLILHPGIEPDTDFPAYDDRCPLFPPS